jgi:serine/threonine protein kinase
MVCHRDIKPENLLVIDRLSTKSLKLADFGLAVTVREPLFTVCGTPTYVAPEILAETGYGVKVWAWGMFFYLFVHCFRMRIRRTRFFFTPRIRIFLLGCLS